MTHQCSPINKVETVKIKYDSTAAGILLTMIIAATFLQKVAIPVADIQIFLGLPIIVGLTAFGFITRRLVLKSRNFILYLFMVGIIVLTQILGGHIFSFASMFLLIIVHCPYAFGLKANSAMPGIQFLYFQRIMVIIAIAGILQYAAQFIIGGDIAFFLDTMFPQSIIMQGYNGTIPLQYGSSFYKSNGVFLQEPSSFSQLLAVAIVVEAIYFKNWKRVVLFLAAISLTFSGTGLIILFALIPIYLIHYRKFFILTFLLVAVLTAPLWGTFVGLGGTINRTREFTDTRSSGYARFVSIVPTLNTYIVPQTNTFLFGLGSGSILRTLTSNESDYEWHNPSWGKMIFEYGIIGGLAYFIFIGFVFWKGCGSVYIKAALLIQLMILGEFVLPPTLHSLILPLLIWPTSFSYGRDYNARGKAFLLKIKH
ncbi:MAG: hypothetical protein COB36_03345 [Alphaproteobacteria bacterium]|nr:MAG: hypothetical protein COB36_03345 [Alphaproteobacteria bacterium]